MINARRWPIRASLALGLIVIPLNFSFFTVNAANFIKIESANGDTLWVDREVGDFSLNPDWKIVRIMIRLKNGTKSQQRYIVDFTHNKNALIEGDGQKIPVEEWTWQPNVPKIR